MDKATPLSFRMITSPIQLDKYHTPPKIGHYYVPAPRGAWRQMPMRLILSVSAVIALLTALSITPLFAQATYIENESDYDGSHYQYPDEGQNLLSGHISYENDVDDWYSLPGTGVNTTLTLTFNPAEVEIDWEVIDDGHDPDYWDDQESRTLATLTNYGSPESVTIQTFGHCVIHLWAYSGEGNYTINVGEVTCQGEDEFEPNDTQFYASPAPYDMVAGHVCPGDSDWYFIEGREGEYWSLTLNFDPTEVEVDWEIYSDDQRVAVETNYGSPDILSCDVPGTCYIHVWQFTGAGDYRIDLAGYTNSDI
jgi:hypothetical protein